jgi:chitinase
LANPSSAVVYDYGQQVPYAYNGDQWYGYDNIQSVDAKIAYIKAGGYGGFMVWAIDLDDFSGQFCGQGKYPLMTRMNLALLGSVPTVAAPPATTAAPAATTIKAPAATDAPAVGTTKEATSEEEGGVVDEESADSDNLCDGKTDGIYADPGDCTGYIHCNHGQPIKQSCSSSLYFNPVISTCDYATSLTVERQVECGLTAATRRRRRSPSSCR